MSAAFATLASIQILDAMSFKPFLHGVALAIGLVVPLGPQNLFVFGQGAMNRRFRHAIPAVVTAAVCDTLLILLAVAGVSAAVLQSSYLKVGLLGVGVAFLLCIVARSCYRRVTPFRSP